MTKYSTQMVGYPVLFFFKYAGIKTHQPLFVKPGPCWVFSQCSLIWLQNLFTFVVKIFLLAKMLYSFWNLSYFYWMGGRGCQEVFWTSRELDCKAHFPVQQCRLSWEKCLWEVRGKAKVFAIIWELQIPLRLGEESGGKCETEMREIYCVLGSDSSVQW